MSQIHPTDPSISSAPEERKEISRRELIKTLTALGGATAASLLLPQKWTKPAIGAGVLPAHAQSTQPTCARPVLGNGSQQWIDPTGACEPGSTRSQFLFSYHDASGNVISGSTSVRLLYRFESGAQASVSGVSHEIIGSPSSGTVDVRRCISWASSTYIDYTFWLTNACGQESDPIQIRAYRPQTNPPSAPGGEERG
jgi:hypothetical protein